MGTAKKRKTSSMDTSACHLATTSVIASTDSWPFQREITVSEDDVESYQLLSHQLDLPLVLRTRLHHRL